ncbi:hypothetical protein EJ04DRAFT_543127 [Polyplosphaeria fusca]|uniref:Mediator of RNA polymerase II transcription subunit 1 n=1 Tax=Polyplosphaeria fusca TaxID=682080 RepID=A0A9P4QWP9_9PLEO|nr:hypothetical protein EJ04DRAFT_543127 [Polyplosphaeria fusca]
MATPTPSTNTPQRHLPAFSSPAPRSVPGTGPVAMNFDSPAALGIHFGEGGVGMGLSMSMSGLGMSGLGLSASAMGRADEDERRRRLESIIATLKAKPGRVGEEGIIGLCKKEGLEVERETKPGGGVVLVLLIGSEALCEIPIRNGEIESVKLEINADEIGFGASGSKILLESLQPLPGMTKINNTLERFSHNLDKILRWDRLGAPAQGSVSCFQAIFGVYTSLKKLFEHEKKLALAVMEANTPLASQKAEREVLCKKSGRPRLNANKCLGLSLEYWMDRRHVIKNNAKMQQTSGKGKEKMDIDSEAANDYPEDQNPDTNQVYSMTIEFENSPASMYSPIRVSDAWISDAVEKAPDAAEQDLNKLLMNQPTIDWLDPPPTYLQAAAPAGEDAMNLDSTGRLPNVRFIAKFNPPLVMPLGVLVALLQSHNVETRDIEPTTFVGLALRPDEPDPGLQGSSTETTHEIRSEKTVLSVGKDGKEEQHTHTYSLYVPKTDYAKTLESLPFSHPRQLIEILPTLRQYAFTNSLLRRSFLAPPPSKTALASPSSPSAPTHPTLQVDLSLTYAQPAPRLTLTLPHPSSTTSFSSATDLLSSLLAPSSSHKPPISVTLDVSANADLVVLDQNVAAVAPVVTGERNGDMDVDMRGMQENGEKVKRVGGSLEVCGDLGVWGAWLRREGAGE